MICTSESELIVRKLPNDRDNISLPIIAIITAPNAPHKKCNNKNFKGSGSYLSAFQIKYKYASIGITAAKIVAVMGIVF
jgi:hypothetical protein